MAAFGEIYQPKSTGYVDGDDPVPVADCWKRIRITLKAERVLNRIIQVTDDERFSYMSKIFVFEFEGTLKKTCECLNQPEEPDPSLFDDNENPVDRKISWNNEKPRIYTYEREDITWECENCKKANCYCEPQITIPLKQKIEVEVKVQKRENPDGTVTLVWPWNADRIRDMAKGVHDSITEALEDWEKEGPESFSCNLWTPPPPQRGSSSLEIGTPDVVGLETKDRIRTDQ